MYNIKQVLLICQNNIRRCLTNPRIYMSFLLVFVLIQQLIIPIRDFSQQIGIKTAPWIFPYLCQYHYIQMIIILGIVLLFCDAPFMNESTPFLLIRSGRRNWILGQLVYVITASLLYIIGIVIMSILLLHPQVEWQLGWGKILGTLAQTNAAAQIGVVELSLDYKMQLIYSPLQAMFYSILMSWLVGIITGLLMLVFNLYFKRLVGPMVGAVIAFLPYLAKNFSDYYDIYYISPASWMNIVLFAGDETSKLPSLEYIKVFIFITSVVLIAISILKIKKRTIEVLPEI